jgi:hypothetical protein
MYQSPSLVPLPALDADSRGAGVQEIHTESRNSCPLERAMSSSQTSSSDGSARTRTYDVRSIILHLLTYVIWRFCVCRRSPSEGPIPLS